MRSLNVIQQLYSRGFGACPDSVPASSYSCQNITSSIRRARSRSQYAALSFQRHLREYRYSVPTCSVTSSIRATLVTLRLGPCARKR